MDIEINGVHYASWDEVPPEVRATLGGVLGDRDGNGQPDLIDGLLSGGTHITDGTHISTRMTRIQVGDQTYDSIEDAPPAVQEALRRAGLGGPGGAAPTSAAVPSTPFGPPGATPPPAPSGPPPGTGQVPGPPPGQSQVLLNGVPMSVDAATGRPRKKRWWRFGR